MDGAAGGLTVVSIVFVLISHICSSSNWIFSNGPTKMKRNSSKIHEVYLPSLWQPQPLQAAWLGSQSRNPFRRKAMAFQNKIWKRQKDGMIETIWSSWFRPDRSSAPWLLTDVSLFTGGENECCVDYQSRADANCCYSCEIKVLGASMWYLSRWSSELWSNIRDTGSGSLCGCFNLRGDLLNEEENWTLLWYFPKSGQVSSWIKPFWSQLKLLPGQHKIKSEEGPADALKDLRINSKVEDHSTARRAKWRSKTLQHHTKDGGAIGVQIFSIHNSWFDAETDH